MKSRPIYCGLAFGGLTIDQEKAALPCCAVVPEKYIRDPNNDQLPLKEKINNYHVRKIRNKLMSGVWHPACNTCKSAELSGSYSMRSSWSDLIPNAPMVEYVDPKNIKNLTISLGRKCNSKCMTCNPGASTLWIDEWKEINPHIPIRDIPEVMITDEFSLEILDTLPNIEYVSFFGGEPLIIDEHTNFLKFCIERGISKNITLGYTTNLTRFGNDLADLWKNFKGVSAAVSIDGYGLVNDYIRFPIKFSKVEKNLNDYLDLLESNKFFLTISATVSLLNINEFADLMDFYISLIIEKKKTIDDITLRAAIFYNRVISPDYLNSSLLSVKFRKKGLKKIQKVRERINSLGFKLHPSFLQTCNLIESWCKEPHNCNRELITQAVEFITKSDQFRNHNINDYIPGLLDELKSYLPIQPMTNNRKIFKINSLSFDQSKT